MADKSFLCYFVQFLETRSALALIKFWIDADSFKSSAELCSTNPRRTHPRPHTTQNRPSSANGEHGNKSPRRKVLSKSFSLNIGAFDREEPDPDDSLSLDAISDLVDDDRAEDTDDADELREDVSTEPTALRDVGDGSSKANSMTNVSDICNYGPLDFPAKSAECDKDGGNEMCEKGIFGRVI